LGRKIDPWLTNSGKGGRKAERFVFGEGTVVDNGTGGWRGTGLTKRDFLKHKGK